MVQKSSKPLSLVFLFSYHLQCSCIFSGGDRRISEPSAVWNMFFAHTSLMTKLGYASLSYHGQMFFRIQQLQDAGNTPLVNQFPTGWHVWGYHLRRKLRGSASKSPPSSCRTCKRSCQAFPPKCPQVKISESFDFRRWKMMGGKVEEPLSDEFYQTNKKKIRHYNVHLTHYTPAQSLMDASCKISERSEVFQHLE